MRKTRFLCKEGLSRAEVHPTDDEDSPGRLIFDSNDQSIFGCHHSKGLGVPVGEPQWRDGKEKKKGKVYIQKFSVDGNMRSN